MTGITINNVQRAVTPKVGNLELWFLCSAYHGGIHLYKVSRKYLKHFSSYRNQYFQFSKGYNSKSRLSRVRVRAITPKVGKSGLWFMSSACCLMAF